MKLSILVLLSLLLVLQALANSKARTKIRINPKDVEEEKKLLVEYRFILKRRNKCNETRTEAGATCKNKVTGSWMYTSYRRMCIPYKGTGCYEDNYNIFNSLQECVYVCGGQVSYEETRMNETRRQMNEEQERGGFRFGGKQVTNTVQPWD